MYGGLLQDRVPCVPDCIAAARTVDGIGHNCAPGEYQFEVESTGNWGCAGAEPTIYRSLPV